MKLRSEHEQLQSCHYRADGHTMNMLREDTKKVSVNHLSSYLVWIGVSKYFSILHKIL